MTKINKFLISAFLLAAAVHTADAQGTYNLTTNDEVRIVATSAGPYGNAYNDGYLSVYEAIFGSYYNRQRSLIKYDLSGVTGSVVSASLTLTTGYSNPGPGAIDVYRVASDWNRSQVTWYNATSGTAWVAEGGDYAGNPASSTAYASFVPQAGVNTVDVTYLVKSWINGSYANYGLELTGSGATDGSVNTYFYPYQFGTAQPTLNIVTTATETSETPEPGTLALLFTGSISGTLILRRRRALCSA